MACEVKFSEKQLCRSRLRGQCKTSPRGKSRIPSDALKVEIHRQVDFGFFVIFPSLTSYLSPVILIQEVIPLSNKKTNIAIVSALLIAATIISAVFTLSYLKKPNGKTLESRQEILRGVDGYENYSISSETEIDGYIASSIHSSNRNGIAIFKPKSNGRYAFASVSYTDKGEGSRTLYETGENCYHFFMLDKPDLLYAEIKYTPFGEESQIYKVPAETGKIIPFTPPDLKTVSQYSLGITITYKKGKTYEF